MDKASLKSHTLSVKSKLGANSPEKTKSCSLFLAGLPCLLDSASLIPVRIFFQLLFLTTLMGYTLYCNHFAVIWYEVFHLPLWREELSSAARFSPNAVIISLIFVYKSNLIFFIYIIFLSGIQVFFVQFFSMAYLLLCAWFITDLLRIYIICLHLFKRPRDCCEN